MLQRWTRIFVLQRRKLKTMSGWLWALETRCPICGTLYVRSMRTRVSLCHAYIWLVRQHQFKVFLHLISLQFQNRKLFMGLSSSWLSYILLLQLHKLWIECFFLLLYLKHIFDEKYSLWYGFMLFQALLKSLYDYLWSLCIKFGNTDFHAYGFSGITEVCRRR